MLLQLLNIPEHSSGQKPGRRLLAGAMAGVTSITATYPLDLVRYDFNDINNST